MMPEAFQIKGSVFTLSTLHIFVDSLEEIEKQVIFKVKQAPNNFLENAPMIIDLTKLTHGLTIEFIENLVKILKKYKLLAIGFRLPTQNLSNNLQKKGFPIFEERRNISISNKDAERLFTSQSKIISSRVRSGQQIIAQDGDLIILSSVSPGAEILASGNIHVYGALQGRALAGINGNVYARIFCHQLEAELVSIAGHYKIFETSIKGNEINNGYQVQLKDDTIEVSFI